MILRFLHRMIEFGKQEDGPTAVEYGVMLALIIVACITAVSMLGSSTSNTFSSVGSSLGTSS